MKLSRTVNYALRATLLLAECPIQNPVPCSKLASSGKMPERFLLQILRSLVRHGILNSTRGVDGGYRLHRHPDDISLLDVIEAVDGPYATAVAADNGLDGVSQERLIAALQQITTASRQQLEAIKLSSLLPCAEAGC